MHRAALSHSAAFDFVTLDAILIVSERHPMFVSCSLQGRTKALCRAYSPWDGYRTPPEPSGVTPSHLIRLPSISSPLMPSFSIPERIFINNHWLTLLSLISSYECFRPLASLDSLCRRQSV